MILCTDIKPAFPGYLHHPLISRSIDLPSLEKAENIPITFFPDCMRVGEAQQVIVVLIRAGEGCPAECKPTLL